MHRACESKDQTCKKIRTSHSPEKGGVGVGEEGKRGKRRDRALRGKRGERMKGKRWEERGPKVSKGPAWPWKNQLLDRGSRNQRD